MILARALAVVLTAGVLAVAPTTAAHAVDPVPGPQTAGDTQFPNVGNGGYDVSDYDINMVWTPATIPGITTDQSIVATTTITAATTGAPLSSFSFDFEGLTLDSVTVNGVAATTSRVQDAGQTKFKLVVTPATPVDGVFTTVVAYHGTPVAHEDVDGSMEGWNATSDGATFLSQPIGSMTGFPNNNTPQDKATYKYTLSIPTMISSGASAAVANGVLTSQTAAPGSRTIWVWDVAKPMASELSMISIGRYNMSSTDLDIAGVGIVKEWSFVDPTTAASSSFTTTRAKITPILEFLSARYGAYPGNSVGLVVDNVLGLGINYALETQDRPFFPGSVSDGTLTHELMHQWFGNNVSPDFWSDLWLNEGPATYSSAQYANESATETTFYNQWNTTTGSTWTTPAANPSDNDPLDLYGPHVYARGAMALEALRTAVGPTDFLAIMAEWQDRYAGTSQGTEDFFALSEEVSGEELTAFFQDWIYDANKPVWPGRFDLALATTPVNGPVIPDSTVTYAATVTNTGKVPLTGAVAGAVVTLDLTDVLDNAVVAGPLPANTSLAGSILTWTVPNTAVGATSTLSLPMTVGPGTSGSTLGATAASSTLGSTCTACTSSLAVQSGTLLTQSSTPTPTVVGSARVGETLAAAVGLWDPGVSLGYQWLGDGAPIAGATASTYLLTVGDLGRRISVTVTGTRAGYVAVGRTSTQTFPVAKGRLGNVPRPMIKGAAVVGERLRVAVGSWPDGVRLKIQWYADGTRLSGGTGRKLLLRQSLRGKRISVKVTGTKQGYRPSKATSRRTAAVV